MSERTSPSLPEDEDSLKNKYLAFTLEEESYGIRLEHILEIINSQKITEVPGLAAHIKGVINLRGQVIPVVDIRIRFGLEHRDYDDRTCIIVSRTGETVVGIIVDQVQEVLIIPEEQISPPPRISKDIKSSTIEAIGKIQEKVIILLDLNKLLQQTPKENAS